MKNISRRNIGGFTLVEILVVVLIIGILSAVAVPMYQGAVDKSRFSTLLPAAKSIKNAEESVRAATGNYTDNMQDLEVNMENEELNFAFDVHNNLADPSLFRITNPKLENVRLAVYFDFNPMMAGQMHCEAKAGDERSNRLCEKLLQGQELGSTGDGYTRYLLDGNIDKPTCDGVSFVWSNKNTKCFKTEEDRCDANGMPYQNGLCGYTNKNNLTIDEGGTCKTDKWGSLCNNVTVNDGGTCLSTGHSNGCYNSTFNSGSTCSTEGTTGSGYPCSESTFTNATCSGQAYYTCHGNTFNEGSICHGNASTACSGSEYNSGSSCIATNSWACRYSTYNDGSSCEGTVDSGCYSSKFYGGSSCVGDSSGACSYGTFESGSKCVANVSGSCKGGTYNGGCCEGPYCPKGAPKC